MRTATIAGGGVTGPSTAMGCSGSASRRSFRAHARTDGEVGSYFTLSPNGLDALDAIGALDLARSLGFASRRNVMVSSGGRTLGTASLGRPLADGTVALTMKRTRLARALVEEAERRGVVVHHGRRLVDATVQPDGRVRVTFDDGTGAAADLLVGADGVHSATRSVIDAQAPRGRYVGSQTSAASPTPGRSRWTPSRRSGGSCSVGAPSSATT